MAGLPHMKTWVFSGSRSTPYSLAKASSVIRSWM